ncbi:MAG TPA: helix-turn-helix transcriptional regulator [Xanthobacteraceae bacterium]|nr:helix-turn-helix transcriptional regulator [Xanthobacteraceae bacterium]
METTSSVRLGERVRKFRREKGWRQIDLAEHSGVHEVHISDIERGAREICLNNLVALAKGLGISVSELVKDIDA